MNENSLFLQSETCCRCDQCQEHHPKVHHPKAHHTLSKLCDVFDFFKKHTIILVFFSDWRVAACRLLKYLEVGTFGPLPDGGHFLVKMKRPRPGHWMQVSLLSWCKRNRHQDKRCASDQTQPAPRSCGVPVTWNAVPRVPDQPAESCQWLLKPSANTSH